MKLDRHGIVTQGRVIALGLVAGLAGSGCASEEVATSPGGMMPPAMAGVKDPAGRVASGPTGIPWASTGAGMPTNPSDPSTLTR